MIIRNFSVPSIEVWIHCCVVSRRNLLFSGTEIFCIGMTVNESAGTSDSELDDDDDETDIKSNRKKRSELSFSLLVEFKLVESFHYRPNS